MRGKYINLHSKYVISEMASLLTRGIIGRKENFTGFAEMGF